MNSFETDLKRAICSINFIACFIIESIILTQAGAKSEIFQISLPVLSAIPYSTAWLTEYQNGYIKEYLPRCGIMPYILGKFLSCGISGGLLIMLPCFLFGGNSEDNTLNLLLMFMSGMFWAVVAATLAAAANSKYVAYGSSFVIFYILIILYERYFKNLYCLYPVEWYAPEHTWVLGSTGIVLMLTGLILITGMIYYEILRRCIEHV